MSVETPKADPRDRPLIKYAHLIGAGGSVIAMASLIVGMLLSSHQLVRLALYPFAIIGGGMTLGGYLINRRRHPVRKWVSIIGLVGTSAVVAVGAAEIVQFDTPPPPPIPIYTYYATGDSQGAIVSFVNLADPSAVTTQQVRLPWHRDLPVSPATIMSPFIVAAGPNGGTVACKVVSDGRVINTDSATGPGAIATC
ncbi:MAG TPA: hypothetical protein VJ914_35075 [Pseudonocardiaceae bacterium]|nr:hypothetical protein [Pseudonocardiaceae bacterium]